MLNCMGYCENVCSGVQNCMGYCENVCSGVQNCMGYCETVCRYAPHNDVPVNDGPQIRRWSHNNII